MNNSCELTTESLFAPLHTTIPSSHKNVQRSSINFTTALEIFVFDNRTLILVTRYQSAFWGFDRTKTKAETGYVHNDLAS